MNTPKNVKPSTYLTPLQAELVARSLCDLAARPEVDPAGLGAVRKALVAELLKVNRQSFS